ncbi:MAG TPA: RNA 2',3'-cyclic phosphodiesterase [Ilumatobacter sp.]|nr:RNA 2',3'-cyclic phosphodiesterase [Ilumatobacter sp.]
MATARLFVCVWPDDDASAELRLLHRKDQPGVRFVPEQNWHVTLRFLGEADPRPVAEALAGVRVDPAEVMLGPVVELLSDHSVIVAAEGLDEWAEAVNRATRGLGTAAIRKRYVGHVTLARLSGRARRGQGRLPGVIGTPVAASFRATELALVMSHLGPAGARYETLATFPAVGTGR